MDKEHEEVRGGEEKELSSEEQKEVGGDGNEIIHVVSDRHRATDGGTEQDNPYTQGQPYELFVTWS
eukprot:665768-Hanusia_phi.AAC.1